MVLKLLLLYYLSAQPLFDGEEGLQNWVRMFRNNVLNSLNEQQRERVF